MTEGGKSPENAMLPEYEQETVQYTDDQLALKLTGKQGTKFEWNLHKWSPTKPLEKGEAIVSTASGNDYYVFSDDKGTYIVNTRESTRQGKPVAAFSENFSLPPVEFGKDWKLPGFYTTTEVEGVTLRYKIASPGQTIGHKIDAPNPFDKYAQYKSTLSKRAR